MNHKIFSFFSVATVSKSRQYRHWKSCLLPATVSKASPLEGSLSPQAFVKSFEITESLGRKRSDRKPLRSQCHYVDVLWCCIFFGISLMFGSMGRLNEGTKITTYRHIIVPEARTLKSLKKHKMIPKNMSCFYFDKHDLATLILIFIIFYMCLICLISLWVHFGFLLQPREPSRARKASPPSSPEETLVPSVPVVRGFPEFHGGKAGEPGRFEWS